MSTTTSERRLVDMEFKPDELPAADATPIAPPTQDVPPRSRRPISLAARLATGAVAALLGLYVIDAAVTLARRAAAGDLLDAAYLVALLVLVGSLIRVGLQQTRALRKLKSAEQARALAAHLAKLDSAGSGLRLLAALQDVYAGNPVVLGQLAAAQAALQPHHSDRDVIELLNREIFAAMDREADRRIQAAAIRATIGVSSCPHPALDAVVVLVMSVLMIRDLMTIYGLRHSLRSLLRVLTHALFTASSTAVMSTVVDFAMRAAHDRLATAVVGTAGEALVVARRMFALGALAKAEIRPLPDR
jgi:putative membrane protein